MRRLAFALALIALVACRRGDKEQAPERPSGDFPNERPLRLAVIGDFGTDSPDEARVAAMVKSWTPDYVLTTGDNNYPNGAASTIDVNVGAPSKLRASGA